MKAPGTGEISVLLNRMKQGHRPARDALFKAVYPELRAIAARYMFRERTDHTLQTTALVNEAYLRLADAGAMDWQGRAHFFSVASQVMRRILVDHARTRGAEKRGGTRHKLELDEAIIVSDDRLEQILGIDELLNRLQKVDSRMSRIVELRFFGGLKEGEIAEVVGVSTRTVKRDWSMARAWLRSELKNNSPRNHRTSKASP